MSEMVERVAKAMWARGFSGRAAADIPWERWDQLGDTEEAWNPDCKAYWLDLAFAALRAAHEPTDDMLDYAWPMLTEGKSGFWKEPGRAFWKAAIAAAIAPEAVTDEGKPVR